MCLWDPVSCSPFPGLLLGSPDPLAWPGTILRKSRKSEKMPDQPELGG